MMSTGYRCSHVLEFFMINNVFQILYSLIIFAYLFFMQCTFIVFSTDPYLDHHNNGQSWGNNETLIFVPYIFHPFLYL